MPIDDAVTLLRMTYGSRPWFCTVGVGDAAEGGRKIVLWCEHSLKVPRDLCDGDWRGFPLEIVALPKPKVVTQVRRMTKGLARRRARAGGLADVRCPGWSPTDSQAPVPESEA